MTDPSALIHDVRQTYVVTHSGGGFEDRNVTANTDVRTCPFAICFGPGQFSGVGPSSSLLPINTHPSPTNVNANVVLPHDVNFLKVDQDIFMIAGSIAETDAQSVSFPFIDVTFSQVVVPEPSTMLLLGSGLAGWCSGRKGRQGPRECPIIGSGRAEMFRPT
ncbi:MAG: PEP-CTERM sorting domain-containing protein [Nitrospiraceae bacterium]